MFWICWLRLCAFYMVAEFTELFKIIHHTWTTLTHILCWTYCWLEKWKSSLISQRTYITARPVAGNSSDWSGSLGKCRRSPKSSQSIPTTAPWGDRGNYIILWLLAVQPRNTLDGNSTPSPFSMVIATQDMKNNCQYKNLLYLCDDKILYWKSIQDALITSISPQDRRQNNPYYNAIFLRWSGN